MDRNELAVELARLAGEIQMDSFGISHSVEYKGKVNIVTEVDKKCEELIVERIRKEFPSDAILGEEGGAVGRGGEYKWIVDPLDATVNYNHGYPFFGTSIAIERQGEIVFGVVYVPPRGELFAAERGGGAFLNGSRISVSRESELIRSLLATGFAYNIHEGELRNNLSHFEKFLFKTRAVRRDGMAAGDLCYVAAGRFDGFWELYLNPWDIAAGVIMVEEAGGRVSDFCGGKIDIYGVEIVASNGLIHDKMIEVLSGDDS